MKRLASVLLAALLLASCSEGTQDAPPSSAPSKDSNQATDAEGKPKDKKATSDDQDSEKKERSRPGRKKPSRSGSNGDDGGPAASSRDKGNDAFDEPGTADEGSTAPYPAAGSYVFAQSGFEKFCSGGGCERQALPNRQTARITLRDQSSQQAVVITESSSSDDRMLRTTATYDRAHALVTDVYTRLSYKGFAFENSYHPSPAVESIRFPLEDGAGWNGSWRDSTSGEYSVEVFGPTTVEVRGRSVRAFQLATTTTFDGEFDGTAKTLTWVDPATKAVVKLSGSVDLTSTYGRYVTEFSNSLRSGPGY